MTPAVIPQQVTDRLAAAFYQEALEALRERSPKTSPVRGARHD